jgi:hypothetical protein
VKATPDLLEEVRQGKMDLLTLLREDVELYADMVLKIQTKSGTLVPFGLNATQTILHQKCEKLKAEHGKVRVILLKARQFGGSTYVAARQFHGCVTNPNQHAKVIAHAADHAVKLLEMYHRFYNHLPVELQPLKKYQSKAELTFANPSVDPEARRQNPGLGSSLGVYSAKTAGAGRGSTLRALHCSEVAFWDDAEKVMLGLLNTVPNSGDASLGTEIFIESTANGVGDYFYNQYHRAKRREMGTDFHAIFLPWYLHEEYRVKAPDGFKEQLTSLERNLIEAEHEDWEYVNPGTGRKALSLDQVYWRRITISTQCDHDETRFQQEYPTTDEEAFVTSGDNFFDITAVQQRLEVVSRDVKPVFTGDLEWETIPLGKGRRKSLPKLVDNYHTGKLTIWAKPEEKESYVFFADVGEGLRESDFSVCTILRRRDGFQCAELRGRIEPDRYADAVFDLGHYYNWAYGAPETNAHGLTVLIRLRELGYHNIYKRMVYDKSFADPREQEGWVTSPRTRPLMLDALRKMFRMGEVQVNSVVTLEEMKTFIMLKNKYQAQEGCNDDCVMAMAGACQMLTELPAPQKSRRANWLADDLSHSVKSGGKKREYDRYTGALL